MPIGPGTRLGPYEVVSLIGEGGMGEVWKARDTKLQRDVALKVIPEGFAFDHDRLARFKREAQILASLNHPNIATIHGYEETDDIRALAMELIEGPTLAERITAGPLTANEALTLGKQMAEALEAAHEKGIVHRDLKPANIKVVSDGRLKVLDFGLAKVFNEESALPDLPGAATMTAGPTRAGVILGTTAYMSPEQTRGRPLDKRTDIWAFGCILYEMLTGQRPFGGDTASDLIAGILEREPEWEALPPSVPPCVRQLLGRCLEKDHRHRLRDIGDARLELQEAVKVTERARPSGGHRLSDGSRPSPNREANVYYERALAFAAVGTSNPDQALRMIKRALAEDPKFAGARAEYAFFLILGILNGWSNDPALLHEAEGEVRLALQDDPRCGHAHSVLALIYLLQGRKELVPGELEQALKENAADATAHTWLLQYHRFNGDYQQAREQADWLIRQGPLLYWPGHLNLGELLREQGDAAAAIHELEQVTEQDPQNVYALTAMARAHIDSGNLSKARQVLDGARDDDRNNYGLRQQLALILALEGRKAEASQIMNAELQRHAETLVFGSASAAEFYAVMGEIERALDWLERAVRMGDDREQYLRRNPLLTNLRGHPRFQQIIDSLAYRRQHRAVR